jgi:aryl-alcohol dehydrogenase-like predicted oxidoreductase
VARTATLAEWRGWSPIAAIQRSAGSPRRTTMAAAAALAWVRQQPMVTSTINGVSV